MAPKLDALRLIKLNASNYLQWKMQVSISLKASKIWEYVSGAKVRPDSTGAEQTTWNEMDLEAQALLVSTLDEIQTNHVSNCTTAKEIFDRLKDIHSDASTLNQKYTLNAFYSFQVKPDQTLVLAYNEIQALSRSLKDMDIVINDRQAVMRLVTALPDEKYQAFKKAWHSVALESQAMRMLLSRLKQENLEQAQTTEKRKSSAKAYQGATREKTNADKQKLTELKKKTKCHRCGKKGHWANECHSDMAQQAKGSGNGKGNNKGFSDKRGANGAAAFICQTDHHPVSCICYSDSGATQHVCGVRAWFAEYALFDIPQPVSLSNGRPE